jgi:hypothetical protein
MRKSFAALMLLASTAAVQAAEVKIPVGHAFNWVGAKPFNTVVVGNPELLEVTPGATNRDLNIAAREPTMKEGLYVPIAATSNVLLLNGEGDIVDELRVTVTPNEVNTVNIIRGGDFPTRRTYYCFGYGCIDINKRKESGPEVVIATPK